MVAATLGHYAVEREIGSGGMGVVYVALDRELRRRVAIKVLRPGTLSDPSRRLRLRREAQAASALNHPNIVTIHEIGREGDQDFIVMELVDGTSLRAAIPPDGFGPDEALRYGVPIVAGVAAAHRAGIVHRDLKPSNILVAWDGSIKVVDFGLSRPVDPSREELTDPGMFVGTPGYAAPEQWEGRAADARSDVFALGCILFELLTGKRPFPAMAGGRQRAAKIPRELRRIVSRAMEERPEDRYPSAVELSRELEAVQARFTAKRIPLFRALARPWLWTASAALLALLGAIGVMQWNRAREEAWLETVALPRASALLQSGESLAALRTLQEAEQRVAGDARIHDLLDQVAAPFSIETQPPGAALFIRGFFDPPDAWESLGRSPAKLRLATGRVQRENQGLILRVALDGHAEREVQVAAEFGSTLVELRRDADTPDGMVLVPGGPEQFNQGSAMLAPFWIDRFEVTNREYLRFVRSGGYEDAALWRDTPAGIRERFVDRTGRRGPASWEAGSPPDGADDHPVSGVSWYEASAYCRSRGKELPTLFHWYNAAMLSATNQWAHLSNFNSAGTEPVGHPLRRNVWGSYDMAGNVREWVMNEARAGERWALGGSHLEPSYGYWAPWAEAPANRAPHLGFRCAKYETPPAAETLMPIEMPFRDYRTVEPVGDERFASVRSLYDGSPAPLDARVHSVDDRSPDYRLERVSFAAGYDDERVGGLLFLPRTAAPPYQTVIWFSGGAPFFTPSELSPVGQTSWFLFLIRSGRAVFFPEYEGSFSRTIGYPLDPPVWREIMIGSARDFRRSVDYLQTRADVDPDRLAFYGVSMGATAGVILTALEPRLRASVLLAGGVFFWGWPDEAEPFHFAPRVRVPTLVLNGRHDYFFPHETSQKPLFDRLGTTDKVHVVFESGHLPSEREESTRETLDWLDQWLGPVARQTAPARAVRERT